MSVRKNQSNFWQLQAITFKLLNGDLWWARARLALFVLSCGLLSFFISSLFEGAIPISYALQYAIIPLIFLIASVWIYAIYVKDKYEEDTPSWLARIKFVISLFVLGLIFLFINLFLQAYTGRSAFYVPVQRYLILPIAAFVGALFVGARYIEGIYEIEDYGLAQNYLLASFFGMAYPRLKIIDGKKDSRPWS